jgi:hypothetical protein
MKLPKQLFVKIEGSKGEEFFSPAEKAEHLVEMGQTVKIGRYELVELADATGIAQIVPPKPRRRR